jgi:UDP-N-acetylmuramyl tripeptide synthase
LYLDPQVISHTAGKLSKGSVIVCGTNGKTTVNNLLADTFEAAGHSVICNRTGANLDSGVATALLRSTPADWGVFESDELWLAKTLPQLRSDYVLLLNLFRDQLDRVGEINTIQDSIVAALESSPNTVLVFNADDPLCAAIAARVKNRQVAFGIDGSLGLSQNTVADGQMCQLCSGMLEYEYRQYGQLGAYRCPTCGFERPRLGYRAQGVLLDAQGFSCTVLEAATEHVGGAAAEDIKEAATIHAPYSGAYMVYNLLAALVTARLAGCPADAFQQALNAFNPQNGRLQRFVVRERQAMLNLAKNPTGFNQNLKLIAQGEDPKAVALFINDKEADGHDISWLWDVDFEELAQLTDTRVFAGGIRKHDLQLRLKYAGIDAQRIEGVADVLEHIADIPSAHLYLIANYTALPSVRSEMAQLATKEV